MSTYAKRLASFTSAWPHASPKPQDLARAGLSYMPTKEHPDQVICKLCNTKLFDWLPADDPMLEHHRCSNSCIRLAEGDSPIMFVQDAVVLPPKDSQASSKDPQEASSQKAPQSLPLHRTESGSKTLTFDERLATFTAWPHTAPYAWNVADAGFIHQSTSKKPDNVICKLCNVELYDWKRAEDPMQKHYSYSESCIRFHEDPDMMMFVPDYMASLQEDSQASPLEDQEGSSLKDPQQAPLPEPSLKAPLPSTKEIGFLDPSLQHDFPELCLFHNAHVFCDRIERCRSESRFLGADILALLPKCLRGEALTWFRSQSECQDLAICIEALKARFPQSSQTAPQPIGSACQAPDYHHCKLCNASFSSMARLMRHTQENVCNKPSCRHCDMVFLSKNQLHRHLREECQKQRHRSSPSPSSASSKSSLSPSSRSSSRSSPTWPSTCSSLPSTACSSTCSPISSPAPSPIPSPPPRYRAISPSPPNYLTIADLSTRYARPPYLNVDDLFRMFGGSSATTRSSTIPTSARSSTPAASKHPPIRHRGRCQAKKGDESSQATQHLKPDETTKTTKTKQQQNQKQKIDFVRTSPRPAPYKLVLPLQRSRSVSCPIAAPGSPSFLASSASKLVTNMHWLPMPHI